MTPPVLVVAAFHDRRFVALSVVISILAAHYTGKLALRLPPPSFRYQPRRTVPADRPPATPISCPGVDRRRR